MEPRQSLPHRHVSLTDRGVALIVENSPKCLSDNYIAPQKILSERPHFGLFEYHPIV